MNLANLNNKLSNQRTFLAYLRTGFTISALAGTFKQKWILFFGIFMIVFNSLQYYIIDNNLDKNQFDDFNKWFNKMPLVYSFLSIGILYIQYTF